jgi:hypothetical protein
MYETQKGIPVPKCVRRRKTACRKYPLDTMDVEDMFFIPNREKNTFASHASSTGKALSRVFATRLIWATKPTGKWVPCHPDCEGAVRGIGVWRTA